MKIGKLIPGSNGPFNLGLVGWIVLALGIFGLIGLAAPGYLVAVGALGGKGITIPAQSVVQTAPQVALGAPTGACDSDDPLSTTNIQYLAQRSIADSDSSYDTIQGQVDTHVVGNTNALDVMTYVGTGYQSTGTDPQCGQEVYALFQNATFYNESIAAFKAEGTNLPKKFFVDTIATQQLTVAEETSGTYNSTGAFNLSLTTGASSTIGLKIKANTAQGVIRGPLVVSIMHNDTNLSLTASKVVGAASVANPGQSTGSIYTTSWQSDFTSAIKGTQNRLEDFDYVILPVRIEATSAGNPQGGTNLQGMVRIRVVDQGGYILNGQLVTATTSNDAQSDIGAADGNFYFMVH